MGHSHGSAQAAMGQAALGQDALAQAPLGQDPLGQEQHLEVLRGSGCVVIRSKATYDGKQGVTLSTGISRASAGSQALCMHVVTLPPGSRATPHVHDGHESAIWMSAGEAEVWHGPGLVGRTVIHAGDFLYIPPGTPHLPVNRSETETMVAVVARTDPAEQESVVVLDLPPHLAALREMPTAAEG